jgi:hypothetical protein
MSVIPSSIIAVATAPEPAQLWYPDVLFLANWTDGVTLHTSWLTDIQPDQNGTETRAGKLSRPYRTIEFELDAMSQSDSLILQTLIQRAGIARSLIPLYCDVTELSAKVNAGATSLPVATDATQRRFFNGARVAIAQPISLGAAAIPLWELAVISGTPTSSAITLSAGTTNAYVAGTRIFPLIEARLALSQSAKVNDSYDLFGKFSFIETTGNSALPALPAPTVSTFGGFNIFAIQPSDWTDLTAGGIRTGQASKVGIDEYIQVFGTRPWVQRKMGFEALGRTNAFPILQFFDLCRGREQPFFLVSPQEEFSGFTVNTTTIVVAAVGSAYDWNFRPYLAVVQNNGAVNIAQVASWSRTGSLDTITLANTLPAIAASTIRRVCLANLVRMVKDEIVEQWGTDEYLKTSFEVSEVADAVVTVNVPAAGPGTTRLPWYYSAAPVVSSAPAAPCSLPLTGMLGSYVAVGTIEYSNPFGDAGGFTGTYSFSATVTGGSDSSPSWSGPVSSSSWSGPGTSPHTPNSEALVVLELVCPTCGNDGNLDDVDCYWQIAVIGPGDTESTFDQFAWAYKLTELLPTGDYTTPPGGPFETDFSAAGYPSDPTFREYYNGLLSASVS